MEEIDPEENEYLKQGFEVSIPRRESNFIVIIKYDSLIYKANIVNQGTRKGYFWKLTLNKNSPIFISVHDDSFKNVIEFIRTNKKTSIVK